MVRRAVAPRLKTRLVPTITFEFDESIQGVFRVEGLIREARATDADAARPSGSAGGPESAEAPPETAPHGGDAREEAS